MYVCICNGITDRAIAAAVDEGARTPEHLAERLGVGLCCGRCKSCAHAVLAESLARVSCTDDAAA